MRREVGDKPFPGWHGNGSTIRRLCVGTDVGTRCVFWCFRAFFTNSYEQKIEKESADIQRVSVEYRLIWRSKRDLNLLQCALWCGRLIVYEKYTNQCGLCGEVRVEDPCGFIDGAGLGLGVPALGCQDVGVAHQLLGYLRADLAFDQHTGELVPELVGGEVGL